MSKSAIRTYCKHYITQVTIVIINNKSGKSAENKRSRVLISTVKNTEVMKTAIVSTHAYCRANSLRTRNTPKNTTVTAFKVNITHSHKRHCTQKKLKFCGLLQKNLGLRKI